MEYTYLSVSGALEVSVEGGEGVILGSKVLIPLLQRRLGGRGPGDGRHWEVVDGSLKLSEHGTPLAEDLAGQLFCALDMPLGVGRAPLSQLASARSCTGGP